MTCTLEEWLSTTEPGLSANSLFLSLFLNSLFIGSNGQALLPVAGAHVRDESLEFIEVDSPMPPEYGAGINLFSPL